MTALAVRDTRSQILDAAEAVVMCQGVRNLTLDAVAAHAGVP
jgi:AcrR family transcriptional regulator